MRILQRCFVPSLALACGLAVALPQPASAKRVCRNLNYVGTAWHSFVAWGQTKKQARTAAKQLWVRRVVVTHGFQFARIGTAKSKRYFCSRCRKTALTFQLCRNASGRKIGHQTGYFCYLVATPCVRS